MLTKGKKYFVLYWKYQIQNMKTLLQYKMDFFIQIIFTVISQLCNILVVAIICNNSVTIEEWRFEEMIILSGFLVFSEGCINFFFQGAWKISDMINQADLDRFLLRPIPLELQILTARIDFEGICKMVMGIVLIVTSLPNGIIDWSIKKSILVSIFLLETCVIRVCMIWIASCVSFWMEGGKNSINFFVLALGELAKYPLNIYPLIIQSIFAYLIPYAFVSYYPVGYLLEKSNMEIGVMMTPLVCVLMLIIAKNIFNNGIRRYESCGN